MKQSNRATEFSLHLSRSKMARFLQQQLNEQEKREVEVHLAHCERCSEEMLQCIQQNEPQHAKTYHKQLKGKLKKKEVSTSHKLSKTNLKLFRAVAAVVLVFIFSFLAVDIVMHQRNSSQKPLKAQVQEKKELKIRKSENVFSEEEEAVAPEEETTDQHMLAMHKQPTADNPFQKPYKAEQPVYEKSIDPAPAAAVSPKRKESTVVHQVKAEVKTDQEEKSAGKEEHTAETEEEQQEPAGGTSAKQKADSQQEIPVVPASSENMPLMEN